jgi:phosphoribosyl-ATP pyrophosphohydrolase
MLNKEAARFVKDYFAELEAGNAAVFAGAGLSAPAGFVDWRGLLRGLAEELDLDVDLETDLVSLAQFHVNANGRSRNRLNQVVIDALSADTPPTANHRLLARLPITTWWTTNYDRLIETSLRDAGKIVDVKADVMQLANTKPRRDAIVYKMHGDVDRPHDAVVTRDDYEAYPRDRGAFINALAGDLVSKTFLFLGFSFTDPNLEQVLVRVRLTFQENQRRHFAIFKRRARESGETDDAYSHARARQLHVIADLKLFNVHVLLVEEYVEIDEILAELERRYRRQTVFVSASADDFSPWGQEAVEQFMRKLGDAVIGRRARLATGLGRGVGNALFTGAVERVLKDRQGHIEDSLIIRPFPQAIPDRAQRAELWRRYRQGLIPEAGVAIFLFGNKLVDGKLVPADGMEQEFEIAREHGLVVIPVGGTGSTAKTLAERVLAAPDEHLGALADKLRPEIAALMDEVVDLDALVEPIARLVAELKQGV